MLRFFWGALMKTLYMNGFNLTSKSSFDTWILHSLAFTSRKCPKTTQKTPFCPIFGGHATLFEQSWEN